MKYAISESVEVAQTITVAFKHLYFVIATLGKTNRKNVDIKIFSSSICEFFLLSFSYVFNSPSDIPAYMELIHNNLCFWETSGHNVFELNAHIHNKVLYIVSCGYRKLQEVGIKLVRVS